MAAQLCHAQTTCAAAASRQGLQCWCIIPEDAYTLLLLGRKLHKTVYTRHIASCVHRQQYHAVLLVMLQYCLLCRICLVACEALTAPLLVQDKRAKALIEQPELQDGERLKNGCLPLLSHAAASEEHAVLG